MVKIFKEMRKMYDRAVRAVGLDRVAHCLTCALLTVAGAGVAAHGAAGVTVVAPAVTGVGLAMGVGLMKEWSDSDTEGDFFDFGDVAADAFGCLLGVALWWLVVAGPH